MLARDLSLLQEFILLFTLSARNKLRKSNPGKKMVSYSYLSKFLKLIDKEIDYDIISEIRRLHKNGYIVKNGTRIAPTSKGEKEALKFYDYLCSLANCEDKKMPTEKLHSLYNDLSQKVKYSVDNKPTFDGKIFRLNGRYALRLPLDIVKQYDIHAGDRVTAGLRVKSNTTFYVSQSVAIKCGNSIAIIIPKRFSEKVSNVLRNKTNVPVSILRNPLQL